MGVVLAPGPVAESTPVAEPEANLDIAETDPVAALADDSDCESIGLQIRIYDGVGMCVNDVQIKQLEIIVTMLHDMAELPKGGADQSAG